MKPRRPAPSRDARPGKPSRPAKPAGAGKPSSRPPGKSSSRPPGKPAGRPAGSTGERAAAPRGERPAEGSFRGKSTGGRPRPAPAGKPANVGKRRPRDFDPRRLKPDKGHIWQPGPDARTIRSEAGQDLAHFLVSFVDNRISVRKAREALENGCCRINGRIETFGSYVLKAGEIVEFLLPDEGTEHHFDPRRVLHDDRGVLAYDKPAFLPVVPQDGPKSWSLLDILQRAAPYVDQPLLPVHRLDADTSGIVLFAKDPTVAGRLETMFKDHAVEKSYLAIVRGHPREEGLHKSYLVKVASRTGYERWKSGRGPDAREAITTWKVEERLGKYGSLVRVMPKTGRYHQIRLHFSELGHPLYGDRLYGDRLDPVHVNRHLLHASEVRLPNPGSGPELRLRCALPRDMVTAMERIRKL